MHRFTGTTVSTACLVPLLLLTGPAALRSQEHTPARVGAAHEYDRHDHGGYPEFVDVFFTHHAYLERKIHPRLAATMAESARVFEESAEVAWQFSERLGGEIEIPFLQIDPDVGDGAGGIGDIEVAPMVVVYGSPERLVILSARSGFTLPTGDEKEGLGADGWGWEPGLLLWKGYGAEGRGALQAELSYERLYADAEPDEEELVYNLAWSHRLPSNWIPIAELNGVARLRDAHVEPAEHDEQHSAALSRVALRPAHGGEIEAEEDLISATLGLRFAFANGQQWGGGVQLPISGTNAYDWRLVVGGIIHLD